MSRKGYFTKNGSAYVVEEIYSQLPFTNVLYNEDGYVAEVTQWGDSTVTAQFEDKEICNVLLTDSNAFYIRNEATGKVWCPGAEPMHSKVEDFQCEHGDGYSVISSSFEGVQVSIRTFVPEHGYRQVWSVEVTNNGTEAVSLSVVPAMRPIMFGFSAPRFCNSVAQSYITTFEEVLNGMYFKCGNPNAKDKPYDAFLVSDAEVNYYSGEIRKVFAAPMALSNPVLLLEGKNLDSATAMNDVPFMALQNIVKLDPGAKKRMDYMLGICRNQEEALNMSSMIKNGEVDAELQKVLKAISKRREKVTVQTPDDKINCFVNTWLKKGMEYCLIKKDATRDNLQFALGLTMTEPEVTKETIRLAMRYQYKDGHTVRSWKPLDTTYYSDGQIWLILVTCDYLKYSDDLAFLEETVPYFDGGEGSVLEHLEAGIQRLQEDKGPHNLCLARWADWNDALNLADPEAESVFVSMGFAWCLKEMAELMAYTGKQEKTQYYIGLYKEIKGIINDTCWDEDGAYYVRGFSEGKVIGGSQSEGSVIFANPQTWAVLSGVATKERVEKIVAATDKYMVTDLGCLVNYPAYDHYMPELGRITYQVPGTTENGAVYCHVTAFKINADAQRGDGDRAYRDLKKIMPDSEQNPYEVSGALPYTLTSCYATNEHIYGRTGRPWLTGSQGWVMRCVVEGLLGIRKAYGGFMICPALPEEWEDAKASVTRNHTEYIFDIKRTGTKSITVDGVLIKEAFVPFADKKQVYICVTV